MFFATKTSSAVAHSFSKDFGLAGERIGYLALHPSLATPASLAALAVCQRALGFVNASATTIHISVARCSSMSRRLALRARWVFPVDGVPLANGTVEIDDGRIAAVHDRFDPAARDLGNVAIIPALVNCHTHLELSDVAEPLQPPLPFTSWIRRLVAHRRGRTVTPSQAIDRYEPAGELDVPHMISWADTERDLSAWLGNAMQSNALHELYKLEGGLKEKGDADLLTDWRRLTSSDHFYYMCTNHQADGDVHSYFSPYESPYDSYINFMNVLDNIQTRLRE